MRWFPLLSLLVLGAGRPAPAQDFAPPPSIPPTAEQKRDLSARTEKLSNALTALGRQGVRDPALADIEVFHKAAEWIVRHNEFYQKEAVDWTREALDRGLLRASQAAMGESPWMVAAGHAVVRGYRSRIDDSVQPYGLVVPASYPFSNPTPHRLDFWCHGRGEKLTELSFIQGRLNSPGEFTRPDAAVRNLERLIELGLPTVTGTTGWTEALPQITGLVEHEE